MKMNQMNKIWNLKEILINSLKYLLKEKISEKYVLKKSDTGYFYLMQRIKKIYDIGLYLGFDKDILGIIMEINRTQNQKQR